MQALVDEHLHCLGICSLGYRKVRGAGCSMSKMPVPSGGYGGTLSVHKPPALLNDILRLFRTHHVLLTYCLQFHRAVCCFVVIEAGCAPLAS